MKIRKFLAKLFPPKVMFLQSMIVVHYRKDGKKYLQIARLGQDGVIDRKIYQVEHLVNENLEVTDQTLEEEEKWFHINC